MDAGIQAFRMLYPFSVDSASILLGQLRQMFNTPDSQQSSCALEELEPRRLFAVSVSINAGQKFQQIDGFGTAMAWWKTAPYNEPGWTQMYYQDLGSSMLRMDLNINALRGPDDDLTTPVTMVDDLQTNINQFNFHLPLAGQNVGDLVAASKSQKLDD